MLRPLSRAALVAVAIGGGFCAAPAVSAQGLPAPEEHQLAPGEDQLASALSPRAPQVRPGEDTPGPVSLDGVRGTVVDHATGDPIEGATVSLAADSSMAPGPGVRVTDAEGRFHFPDLSGSTYLLSASAPGYYARRDTLQMSGDGEIELRLPLSRDAGRIAPEVLSGGEAETRRDGPPARRWGRGASFLVTRTEIEEEQPRYLTELLSRVPGGIVVPGSPHGYELLLRGQCRPGIWMDGVEVPGVTSIDHVVSPMEVEAVQVYHGFELPVEFGVNSCGGILVWTRTAPSPSSGSETGTAEEIGFLGQLVRVGLVIFVVVAATR